MPASEARTPMETKMDKAANPGPVAVPKRTPEGLVARIAELQEELGTEWRWILPKEGKSNHV